MLDFNGRKKRHISFDALKTLRSHRNYTGFREFVPDLKKEFGELKQIIYFS
jgi:predicted glycosyltransferase involved in capsule biosynthesis